MKTLFLIALLTVAFAAHANPLDFGDIFCEGHQACDYLNDYFEQMFSEIWDCLRMGPYCWYE